MYYHSLYEICIQYIFVCIYNIHTSPFTTYKIRFTPNPCDIPIVPICTENYRTIYIYIYFRCSWSIRRGYRVSFTHTSPFDLYVTSGARHPTQRPTICASLKPIRLLCLRHPSRNYSAHTAGEEDREDAGPVADAGRALSAGACAAGSLPPPHPSIPRLLRQRRLLIHCIGFQRSTCTLESLIIASRQDSFDKSNHTMHCPTPAQRFEYRKMHVSTELHWKR